MESKIAALYLWESAGSKFHGVVTLLVGSQRWHCRIHPPHLVLPFLKARYIGTRLVQRHYFVALGIGQRVKDTGFEAVSLYTTTDEVSLVLLRPATEFLCATHQ